MRSVLSESEVYSRVFNETVRKDVTEDLEWMNVKARIEREKRGGIHKIKKIIHKWWEGATKELTKESV